MLDLHRKLVFLFICLGLALTPVYANETEADLLANDLALAATDLIMDRAADYNGVAEINLGKIDTKGKTMCDSLDLRLSGTGDLRPQTTIIANCMAPDKWRIYIKANVKVIGEYFVASRVIQANETITAADIESRESDLLRKRRAITDQNNIIGWIASRRIARGSLITSNSLRDPNSIMRGQQVQTVAQGVGFAINGVGTAISNGSPGMQIQVRTPNGKVITGTVVDANTVQVPL